MGKSFDSLIWDTNNTKSYLVFDEGLVTYTKYDATNPDVIFAIFGVEFTSISGKFLDYKVKKDCDNILKLSAIEEMSYPQRSSFVRVTLEAQVDLMDIPYVADNLIGQKVRGKIKNRTLVLEPTDPNFWRHDEEIKRRNKFKQDKELYQITQKKYTTLL